MTSGHARPNALIRGLNRFIPWAQTANSPDDVFQAQLVCGVSLGFAAVSVFYSVQTALDARAPPGITVIFLAGSGAYSANLWLLRRRERLRVASGSLLGGLFVLLAAAAAFTTGFRFFNTAWQMCLPLLAIFLVGPRSALLVSLGIMLAAAGLYVAEAQGLWLPPGVRNEPDASSQLLSIVVVLLLVVALGGVYERAHDERRRTLAATIDELRRTHDELKVAQRQLLNSEKLSSLGLMAAGIAHEINNPMAFVTSNLSSLARDLDELVCDGELRREYADEVLPATLDGVSRVNAIVGDLRRFARGDVEQLVEYDVNAEVAAAARMARAQVHKHGSRLELQLGALPKVRGRPRQVTQVVMNLVLNAAQACRSGGTVSISTRATEAEIAIAVTDTGAGMSEQTLAKLFQPFFTTKPVGEGTGLGLAVVHGIVTAHGGRIDVQSQLGQGSAFTVWLPKAPAEPLRAAA